jgi:cadmium resistance protein CadD (predicted permease)
MDFRDELLERAEYKCQSCGDEINMKTLMVDHIVPEKHGGTSDIDNLQALCPKCCLFKVDKILSAVSSPVAESAAKLWVHSYLKSPAITIIFTIISFLIGVFAIYEIDKLNSSTESINMSQSPNFDSQLKQLDETEKSLRTLLKFVSVQRESAIKNEQRINQLEQEKERLEPLVNADKAAVEALFQAQEERAEKNAKSKLWFGIFIGIITSIIASIIIAIVKYFWVSRKARS